MKGVNYNDRKKILFSAAESAVSRGHLFTVLTTIFLIIKPYR